MEILKVTISKGGSSLWKEDDFIVNVTHNLTGEIREKGCPTFDKAVMHMKKMVKSMQDLLSETI